MISSLFALRQQCKFNKLNRSIACFCMDAAKSLNDQDDQVEEISPGLWVGVGYRQGSPRTLIETAIHEVFRVHQLAESAIAGLATLDRKAEILELVELCRDRRWALRGFSAEQLRSVEVPTPSAIVQQKLGTLSVCEAAAILASQRRDGLAAENLGAYTLHVAKKIFHAVGQPGAVTIAVAQARAERGF